MKKIGIIQTSYLPWIGYFNIIKSVDQFVFLDTVQFDMSWRNRNRIRVNNAEGFAWLTVPVLKKGKVTQSLADTKVDNAQKWAPKHWNLIYQHYHKAPHFASHAGFFEDTYLRKNWDFLLELNYHCMDYLLKEFSIVTPTSRARDLDVAGLRNNDLNLAIIRQFDGDYFLANNASRDYMIVDNYESAGIQVGFHNYQHPVYSQQYEPFVSHLSVLDLLFNCGTDAAAII